MDFREFFEKEQIKDESVLGVAKALWGTGKGVLRTGAGIMTIGDEAIAKLMGQGTKGRMKGGWRQLKRGVGEILVNDGKPKQAEKPAPKQAEKPAPQAETRREKEWNRLLELYKKAKTTSEKEEIQRKMGMIDPDRYGRILQKIRRPKRR